MKKLLMFLLIFGLVVTPVFAQISISFDNQKPKYTASKELDKKLLSQTVSIVMFNRGMGTCSGTIIYETKKNHYVLTAKHCIDVTEELYVEHKKVLYTVTSADDDLALLVVDGKIPNKTVAKISAKNALISQIVHHVAYPGGVVYKTSGKVTRNSSDWQFIDLKAIGGCSGGGVFDIHGNLVSVLWGGYRNITKDTPVKSVTEPIEDVIRFLKVIGMG